MPLERAVLHHVLASARPFAVGSSATPAVSIIVLVHNRAELTLRCIRALAGGAVPFELLIVDNASADETPALLTLLEDATIIRHDQNIGFVRGVNEAARHARGDLLLLLNNDTDPLPGAVEIAAETLLASSTVGAVAGKLVHLDGRLQEAGSIIWREVRAPDRARRRSPGARIHVPARRRLRIRSVSADAAAHIPGDGRLR